MCSGRTWSPKSRLAELYEPVIVGRPPFISFQAAAELRFRGSLARMGCSPLKLQAKLEAPKIVHSGPALVLVHAQLRVDCRRIGHALTQREHDADRWIAATAVRLGIPLGPITASPATYPSSNSSPSNLIEVSIPRSFRDPYLNRGLTCHAGLVTPLRCPIAGIALLHRRHH